MSDKTTQTKHAGQLIRTTAIDPAERLIKTDDTGRLTTAPATVIPHVTARYESVTGGAASLITTQQFIDSLQARGAFSVPHWVGIGRYNWSSHNTISDTGCGNINLSGAIIEAFTNTENCHTVRITTAPHAGWGDTAGTPDAVFILRDFSTVNGPRTWTRLQNI